MWAWPAGVAADTDAGLWDIITPAGWTESVFILRHNGRAAANVLVSAEGLRFPSERKKKIKIKNKITRAALEVPLEDLHPR